MVLLVASYFYEEHSYRNPDYIVFDNYQMFVGLEDVYDCPLGNDDVSIEGACIDLGIAFHFQFVGV